MNLIDLSDPQDRVLPRILSRQARANPDAPFLIRNERRFSFGQADRFARRIAAGLRARGIGAGDRVAFLLSGRPEAVLVALAANQLGALWVPISTDYKGEWLADTVARSRASLLVTEGAYVERLEAVSDAIGAVPVAVLEPEELPAEWIPFEDLLADEPLAGDFADQGPGTPCAILWTSGTTGRSKGVYQCYDSWLRAIWQGSIPSFQSRPGDVIYNVLPLYNSGAWVTSVFRGLVEGLPVVLDGPFSVTEFWNRIRHFGATQSFTLGAMHMFLWNAPERPDDADNPLRQAQMVPMPPDLQPAFERRFGIQVLGAGYGQSECMLICHTLGHPNAPPGCLGFPPEDIELGLFDDDDQPVARGEVGELRIRPLAPNIVTAGYFDDEKATRAAWRGEDAAWYCTGDLGRQDESGAFFFVDRKRDALRFGGRNVSTMEVEGVFRRHPDVADVAAFGIPSEEIASESELKVDFVLAEGATLDYEALASFVNEHAPHYFVPRYMECVDALPYTPTNKVQKYKLREKGVGTGVWDRKAAGYVVRR